MTLAVRRWAATLVGALSLALAFGSAPAAAKSPRVVALTPFAANVLAKLDVRPVAVGQTLGGQDRLSPKLDGVPTLALSHPNGPNLEQLAVRDPDLVLSSPTWRKGNEEIRGLGIKVVESEPGGVFGVVRQSRRIGKLVKRKDAAERLAARFKAGIAKARRGIGERPRVMVILGVGRTPFTFLPNSWGGDLVRKAGGSLLTAGAQASGGFARISDELVVASNPEVIIAVPHADPGVVPELTAYLQSNPAWQSTEAAQNGRIYVPTDNSLLQPGTDVTRVIRKVRAAYLDNL